MTAKERLIELQESKSEYRAKGGQGLLSLLTADSPLRREVRYLTKVYLHRTLTGCSSCAMDAYFELLNIKPTDIDMETKLYELKAGALLYDREADAHYSGFNLTDEVAEKLLKAQPINIQHFRKFPEDWQARVAGEVKQADNSELVVAAIEMIEADPKATKTAVVKALRAKGALAKDAEAAFVAAVKALEEKKPELEAAALAADEVPEVPEVPEAEELN